MRHRVFKRRISDWFSTMSNQLGQGRAARRLMSARLLLRIVLGIVFMVSGAAKMWGIYGFSDTVRNFGVLPESLVVPVTILIPFAEFILGTMLLIDSHPQIAGLSLLAMVVVFTGFAAWKYSGGNNATLTGLNGVADCGCFGKLVSRSIGAEYFAENLLLILGLALIKLKTKRKNLNGISEGG